MTRNRRNRRNKRSGIAAIEAAVCLPILVLVWLGAYEVNQILSLRQQSQSLSATAATRVVSSAMAFADIETEVEDFSASVGIENCEVTLIRIDPEVVESRVEIQYSSNSPIASMYQSGNGVITSSSFSYRAE